LRIACAFDHAGFGLKPLVIDTVAAEGHEVLDLGTWSADPVDYPDTARLAAEAVRGEADRAVLVCGSGAGVAVAGRGHHPRVPGGGVHRGGPSQAAVGQDRRHRTRVSARRHLGEATGMRTIECNICGEPITANDDEGLLARLKDHLSEEHDESPGEDEIQQTIDREAYDAVDS
jgi:predicted small metal-binding protein